MPPQGNITPPADVSIYTSTLDNPGNAEDYNSASESEYDPANDFEVENINGNDGGLVDDCVQASTLEEPTWDESMDRSISAVNRTRVITYTSAANNHYVNYTSAADN